MVTIWGRIAAFNVLKVVWAADEVGCEYRRIDAGRAYGVVDTAEYLKLNPNRKVPVIVDDGFVLWESNVIIRYLCARYSADRMYPADLTQRMEAERWMDWQATEVAATYRPAFRVLGRGIRGAATDEVVDECFRNTNAMLGILDDRLATNRYVAGDCFSMGDIPIGLVVHRWMHLDRPIPGLANVKRWYADLRERAGSQQALSVPLK